MPILEGSVDKMAVYSFIVVFIFVGPLATVRSTETKQECQNVSYIVQHLHQVRSTT